MPEFFLDTHAMQVRLKTKTRCCLQSIVIILAILFFTVFIIQSYHAYAEGELIIDPDSISGESQKEGNILAELGFVVFTEESMSYMSAIKEREQNELHQTVEALFDSDWNGAENYDKAVKEIIVAGNLFSKVNTGVQTREETDFSTEASNKWMQFALTGIMMCVFSLLGIRWRRKRYEHNRNNRAG